jgi:hypothetical protein
MAYQVCKYCARAYYTSAQYASQVGTGTHYQALSENIIST